MIDIALTRPSGPTGRVAVGAASDVEDFAVEVHRDLTAAASAWDLLEAIAPASPYQTRAWVQAWLETTGSTLGIEPMIVVARDASGHPLAMLPLGTWPRGAMTVAGFLGGRDSNFNLGLFRPGPRWTRDAVLAMVRRGARLAHSRVDLVVLQNQPVEWEGGRNPLAAVPGQASPSFAHKVHLLPDPEAFFRATLSKDTRKKLRRKAERLQQSGLVQHREATTDRDRAAFLDAFLLQRTARNLSLGLGTSDLVGLRSFLDRASDSTRWPAAVEVHALFCGERIVATFVGATHRSRFCGMSMSFDTDPALARTSPGELMLSAMLAQKCSAGLTVFDLGIGEARYKDTFCPVPEPLVDALVPITARGFLFAQAERWRLRAKRTVKQSPWAWSAVQAIRRHKANLRRP